MNKSFTYSPVNEEAEKKINRDFAKNQDAAKKVIEYYNPDLPEGMTLAANKEGLFVGYRYPVEAYGCKDSNFITFNQDWNSFRYEADNACCTIKRIANRVNKEFGIYKAPYQVAI